ncbi:MAG: hypothetical protein ACP5TL_02070 [Candidatus Micrarchaeia archaeon]
MRKKVVYTGLLILVVSLAIMYLSNISVQHFILRRTVIENYTVGNNSYIEIPIANASDNSSLVYVSVFSSNSMNYYTFNLSILNKWKAAMQTNNSANGLYYAEKFGEKNTSLIFENRTFINEILEPNKNISTYIVLDNTADSPSNSINVSAKLESSLIPIGKLFPIAIIDMLSVLFIIASIVIIIYGLIRKAKVDTKVLSYKTGTGSSNAGDDYIESLYKSIEKNKTKSKKRKSVGKNG